MAGNHDNARKIAMAREFLDCNAKGACIDEKIAETATKRFLSRAAIAVLDQEKRSFKADDEACASAVPRCYSGLWSEPGNSFFAEYA